MSAENLVGAVGMDLGVEHDYLAANVQTLGLQALLFR